jgi:tetrahydromethanopterin S-methyltransferase subunit F
MNTRERKILNRGIAAGSMVGLAIGLMIALVIAMRPDLFTLLR